MRTSETLAAISPALVAALAKIKGAAKDKKNPHFKSDYATLESVIEASRDILAEHDLAVIQGPGAMCGQFLTVTTRLLHASGEWMESDFQIPLMKADPQAAGSAVSYARRYALMAMLNMPAVDDDGEAAMDRTVTELPKKDLGPSPEGKDFWGCEGPGLSAYQAKKDGLDDLHDQMRQAVAVLPNSAALREFCEVNRQDIARMPRAWRVQLRNEVEERAAELGINLERKAA